MYLELHVWNKCSLNKFVVHHVSRIEQKHHHSLRLLIIRVLLSLQHTKVYPKTHIFTDYTLRNAYYDAPHRTFVNVILRNFRVSSREYLPINGHLVTRK